MTIFYNRNGDIIEIIIRDATMKKIGTWKFNTSDTELAKSIMGHIERKYGFVPTIKLEESINIKPEEEKEKKKKNINFWDMSCDL